MSGFTRELALSVLKSALGVPEAALASRLATVRMPPEPSVLTGRPSGAFYAPPDQDVVFFRHASRPAN